MRTTIGLNECQLPSPILPSDGVTAVISPRRAHWVVADAEPRAVAVMCAGAGEYVALTRNSSSTQSRTLTSSVITLSERLPSGVQRIRDPEELPRLQSPRAAAPQQQQPDKGEGRAVLRTPGGVGGGQRYH